MGTMVFHVSPNVAQGSPLANALEEGVALFQKMFDNRFGIKLVYGDGINVPDFPTTLDQKSQDNPVADNGTNNLLIITDPNVKFFKDNGKSTGDPNLAEGYIVAVELNGGPNLSGGNNLVVVPVQSINIGLKIPGFNPNDSDHKKELFIAMMEAFGHTLSGRDQKDFSLIPYDFQANRFWVPPPIYQLVKNAYTCAANIPSPPPTCTINGPASATSGQNFDAGWYASGDETSATITWDNNTSFTPLRLSDNSFVGSGTSNAASWNQAWQNVHKNAGDQPSRVTVTATGPGGSSQCSYQVSAGASACKAIGSGGTLGDACHPTLSVEQ